MPPIDRADCEALDRADPLRRFRDRFHLPSGLIYLDGNSLGRDAQNSSGADSRVLEQEWGDDLIRSWTKDGWIDLPLVVGAKIGSLIGAARMKPSSPTRPRSICSRCSVPRSRLRPDRRVILSERANFPTDSISRRVWRA